MSPQCDDVTDCICDCCTVPLQSTVFSFFFPQSSEDEVAPGMRLWRKALAEVRSSAQLSLCVQQLQKSITWERSIMKVVSDPQFLTDFLNIVLSHIYLKSH